MLILWFYWSFSMYSLAIRYKSEMYNRLFWSRIDLIYQLNHLTGLSVYYIIRWVEHKHLNIVRVVDIKCCAVFYFLEQFDKVEMCASRIQMVCQNSCFKYFPLKRFKALICEEKHSYVCIETYFRTIWKLFYYLFQ